jgi:hypothetical protein
LSWLQSAFGCADERIWEFYCCYSSYVDICMELGLSTDGSVRLNALGARTAESAVHLRVLPPRLAGIAIGMSNGGLEFNIGVKREFGRVVFEVYGMAVGAAQREQLRSLAPMPEQHRLTDSLAMLGISSCGQVKYYLIEVVAPQYFEVSPPPNVRSTQLCQCDQTGIVRKRYLDFRPFCLGERVPHRVDALLERFHDSIPIADAPPHGIVARSSENVWSVYLPIDARPA